MGSIGHLKLCEMGLLQAYLPRPTEVVFKGDHLFAPGGQVELSREYAALAVHVGFRGRWP